VGSIDNARTWKEIFVLEDEPGEYSYPAVVKTSAGFAVSYTKRRQQIQFCEFTFKRGQVRVNPHDFIQGI